VTPPDSVAVEQGLQSAGISLVTAVGDTVGVSVSLYWRGKFIHRVQHFEVLAAVRGVEYDGNFPLVVGFIVISRPMTPNPDQEAILAELEKVSWLVVKVIDPGDPIPILSPEDRAAAVARARATADEVKTLEG